ncbi:hypothetical protein R3P38DRAFT_2806435 [Favolaschia claudopus]|uniref:Uncharacterized protein n=1 Tax=Favolaschia claudopus TaxID=2862362 RepID=A0AAV9ZK68_9AGAR
MLKSIRFLSKPLRPRFVTALNVLPKPQHKVNPVRRNAKKFEFARGANEMGAQGEVVGSIVNMNAEIAASAASSSTAASPFRATKIHQRDEEVETRMREIVRVCDDGTRKRPLGLDVVGVEFAVLARQECVWARSRRGGRTWDKQPTYQDARATLDAKMRQRSATRLEWWCWSSSKCNAPENPKLTVHTLGTSRSPNNQQRTKHSKQRIGSGEVRERGQAAAAAATSRRETKPGPNRAFSRIRRRLEGETRVRRHQRGADFRQCVSKILRVGGIAVD